MPTICVEGLTGRKPKDLRRGVDIAVTAVVKEFERRSKKAQPSEDFASRNCTLTAGRKLVMGIDRSAFDADR